MSKDFIFQSEGESCLVVVTAENKLSDVRGLILEDFDEDLGRLPCDGDFLFRVDGIMRSRRQEARMSAFELLEKKAKVELVPPRTSRTAKDGTKKTETEAVSPNGTCPQDGRKETPRVPQETAGNSHISAENPVSADSLCDPHEELDKAKAISCQILRGLTGILQEHPDFCSDESSRKEWNDQIKKIEKKCPPKTVIGVLGSTGVGKSSMLNALLDESAVLPTSGSRGCTAAAVELSFNSEMTKELSETQTVPVYRGEIEFIRPKDWESELKVLLDECYTDKENKLVAADDQQESESWKKLETVYGKEFMRQYSLCTIDEAFKKLVKDSRIRKLLSPTAPENKYNSISVEVGEVIPRSDGAKELLRDYGAMSIEVQKKRKSWARLFGQEINAYVYRKGNRHEPQAWPLIHKVSLKGPWSVLSTGAVLVDLPGVRDSNEARASVAEKYIEKCDYIAIVAPIKRAVDDKTAKELQGEQFKRQCLMDGQYDNIFFVCTQTDDIEPTETMNDHQDVAQKVPGRWEEMTGLKSNINDLLNCDDFGSYRQCEILQKQKELKALCTVVRNEYSKDRLQEDFRLGWEELYIDDSNDVDCDDGDEEVEGRSVSDEPKDIIVVDDDSNMEEEEGIDCASDREDACKPQNPNLEVFCISANDFLKLEKIKPPGDGPASAFSKALHTEIPQLKAFVHKCTACNCKANAEEFVRSTNELLDNMKMLAANIENVPLSFFEKTMKNQSVEIHSLSQFFYEIIDQQFKQSLKPFIENGAKKAISSFPATVYSWGSDDLRSRRGGAPGNGLHFTTYKAVVNRNGAFYSVKAGSIDLNQELCDPMIKEYSTYWQPVLVSSVKHSIYEVQSNILRLSDSTATVLADTMNEKGIASPKEVESLVSVAKHSAAGSVMSLSTKMESIVDDKQKELSRFLYGYIKGEMMKIYEKVKKEKGTGSFDRMKKVMSSNCEQILSNEFDEGKFRLIGCIEGLLDKLKDVVASSAEVLYNKYAAIFSSCCEGDNIDRVRECRFSLLPELNKFSGMHGEAYQLLGIERKEVNVEPSNIQIENLKQKLGEACGANGETDDNELSSENGSDNSDHFDADLYEAVWLPVSNAGRYKRAKISMDSLNSPGNNSYHGQG